MKRHLLGLMGAAVGVAVWAACADDPTGVIRGSIARVAPSAAFTEIIVADSANYSARAEDEQGNPLPVLPSVTVADASIARVVVDNRSSGNPQPQTNFRIKALAYGTTTIMMTAGGQKAEMTVRTFPKEIVITGPDTIRSGETATITAQPVDAVGNAVAGVPFTLEVDDETVLAFDDVNLEITGELAGNATISATGPEGDTDAVVQATGDKSVAVIPNVPASAELSAAQFDAVGAGGTATLEVVVTDANGNVNTFEDEILGATAMSSDNGVATVAVIIDDSNSRRVFLEVTGVAAGTVTISGSVQTTEGDIAFSGVPATVLAPVITAAAPSGGFGSTITINGAGLMAAGFPTVVTVDGLALGDVTVVSETQIDARMPTFDAPGTFDLQVSVGGVVSNLDTWEQTDAFDEAATEDNDLVTGGTPVDASLPLRVTGAFAGEPIDDVVFGAGNDYFQFTLTEDATIHVFFDWVGGPDNDVYVTDAAFTDFQCGFAGATGAHPEDFTCDLAAGDYFLILDNFDLEDAAWEVLVEIQ